MIPLQLTLTNFLSYREATLDFRGLHTACICGSNGAGKSSLLEAITWAIWGESRANSEDDVIHTGSPYARVDFQFVCNQEKFQIIRNRTRGKSSKLEFQIESNGTFRPLTAKNTKATQEQINNYLKIDYDTFINSAYLRQGRADEFMLRAPNQRKQILVDLLKLDRYETLAVQARDRAKEYKITVDQLSASLTPLQEQLATRPDIAAQQQVLASQREILELAQGKAQAQLLKLQAQQQQRQLWAQRLTWQQDQLQTMSDDCNRLRQDQIDAAGQLQQLRSQLAQTDEIQAGYGQFLQLQQQEQDATQKYQQYQSLDQAKQAIERELNQRQHQLSLQMQTQQTQLQGLDLQTADLQFILQEREKVQLALAQLQQQSQRLHELDRLQQQVTPLLQRRQQQQTEIDWAKARLVTQIEQINREINQQQQQLAQEPTLRAELAAQSLRLQALEQKKVTGQQIKEAGEEKRRLLNNLKDKQPLSQETLLEIRDKLQRLQIPGANCPLCEQGLDHPHRHSVLEKTQAQQRSLQAEIETNQGQIVVYEGEIEAMIKEYKQINQELAIYETLYKQFTQTEQKLDALGEIEYRLKQLQTSLQTVTTDLEQGNYAQATQQELRSLTQSIQTLNYDEQIHAQQRQEVERWRWAQIQQAKIDDAQQRKQAIDQQKPIIQAEITKIQQELAQLYQDSDLQQKRDRNLQQLGDLGYDLDAHNQLRDRLRQSQIWQVRYQQWQEARDRYPQVQARVEQIDSQLTQREAEKAELQPEIEILKAQIAQVIDYSPEIERLTQSLQQQRRELDILLAQQGRLEQTLVQLDAVQVQLQEMTGQIQNTRKQYRIYSELAIAFGKNGIQALMIENILPQLEAETNQILARLSGNQLHIQFVTQKAGKTKVSKQKTPKYIDTLDILIADAQGTRPYETYSGGESFRINFSIRLALAQLLAQKAGTALQMLIVDEGFGTQDAEGCDRLVAAINAIAPDFACILAVTHMPQFKEAFQHRIEVTKQGQGSQLRLMS
jgi:exonuclease SbcC